MMTVKKTIFLLFALVLIAQICAVPIPGDKADDAKKETDKAIDKAKGDKAKDAADKGKDASDKAKDAAAKANDGTEKAKGEAEKAKSEAEKATSKAEDSIDNVKNIDKDADDVVKKPHYKEHESSSKHGKHGRPFTKLAESMKDVGEDVMEKGEQLFTGWLGLWNL